MWWSSQILYELIYLEHLVYTCSDPIRFKLKTYFHGAIATYLMWSQISNKHNCIYEWKWTKQSLGWQKNKAFPNRATHKQGDACELSRMAVPY